MLWLIHDGKSGQCNPALETIAEKARCARSTVCEAIRALEDAGILSWVNRLVKVRVAERDLFGRTTRAWRVLRSSNAYVFRDPKAAASGGNASKSEFPTGPLDTSFKKETSRTITPTIRVAESADALLMRHGWYHSGSKQ